MSDDIAKRALDRLIAKDEAEETTDRLAFENDPAVVRACKAVYEYLNCGARYEFASEPDVRLAIGRVKVMLSALTDGRSLSDALALLGMSKDLASGAVALVLPKGTTAAQGQQIRAAVRAALEGRTVIIASDDDSEYLTAVAWLFEQGPDALVSFANVCRRNKVDMRFGVIAAHELHKISEEASRDG